MGYSTHTTMCTRQVNFDANRRPLGPVITCGEGARWGSEVREHGGGDRGGREEREKGGEWAKVKEGGAGVGG